MKNSEKTLDMIVNLCKNRGYVYAVLHLNSIVQGSWKGNSTSLLNSMRMEN